MERLCKSDVVHTEINNSVLERFHQFRVRRIAKTYDFCIGEIHRGGKKGNI